MERILKPVSLVFILLFTVAGMAQSDSSALFIAPLNVPIYLAGNYGEIRGGHFHAGLDMKTQQVEGLPVVAAADGYVSRIKIALGGYGNALYITHPSGYTTVYGHLQVFNDTIDEYIKKVQYAQKKFTVEAFPTPGSLPVHRGQVIALSGNSGGSGGPHLHFEIRNTATGVPMNPLLFGFDIRDNIKPTIKNLAIYPMNDTTIINGKNKRLLLPVAGSNGNYHLKSSKITARGVVGFGLEAIDKLNGSSNRCGVYEIQLSADSNVIYEHQIDAIPFDKSRFINAHVDYYEWRKNKKRIQRSFTGFYNKLPIYTKIENGGKVYFSVFGHDMLYRIKDAYNNTSQLAFHIGLDTSDTRVDSVPQIAKFSYDTANYFRSDDISIYFEPYSFYEDIDFKYAMRDTLKGAVSAIHDIQDLYTPLQKYMEVSIKTIDVPDSIGRQFIAVSLTATDRMLVPEGGTYKNGWLTFKTRSLGPYTVLRDSVSPVIKPLNFVKSNTNFASKDRISFKVTDNLSGILIYNGYIDNNWVLVEYDRKTGKIWYRFDSKRLTRGKHTFKLSVTDRTGNSNSTEFNFIW